ncbi:MAG TPA: hypothetical protein VG347_21275 [Verrucomicrobiae bacterium]|nr:hypothetical protein [Verrucomicrobiae bacterium]
MRLFLILFGIYGCGCVLMMWFFIAGRISSLNERNWPWPVIFLWPLLALWPVHALAGYYIKRKTRKDK